MCVQPEMRNRPLEAVAFYDDGVVELRLGSVRGEAAYDSSGAMDGAGRLARVILRQRPRRSLDGPAQDLEDYILPALPDSFHMSEPGCARARVPAPDGHAAGPVEEVDDMWLGPGMYTGGTLARAGDGRSALDTLAAAATGLGDMEGEAVVPSRAVRHPALRLMPLVARSLGADV
jgi:hypothetical protein